MSTDLSVPSVYADVMLTSPLLLLPALAFLTASVWLWRRTWTGVHHVPVLHGTAVVAFLLAAGRWGSHIGLPATPPIFLTDLLITGAIAHYILTRGTQTRPAGPGVALGLLATWSLLRYLVGEPWQLDAIRDVVPYLYAGVGILSAYSFGRATPAARARTVRLLYGAMVVHLAWVLAVQIYPTLATVATVPGSEVEFLTIRSDFDGAIIGVTAAIALRRFLIGKQRLGGAVVLVAAAFTLLPSGSRGAWLAVAVSLGLAVYAATVATASTPNRQRLVVFATVTACAFGAAWLPETNVGQRSANVLAEEGPGAGTASARITAWTETIDYTNETTPRQLFGVGFGPNYLQATDTMDVLRGSRETELRAAHNILVGTYARSGAVGLVLFLWVLTLVARAGWRLRRRFADDELLLTCAALTAGLFAAAAVGVILESPFGAVPFYWSAGILLAAARSDRRPGRVDGADRKFSVLLTESSHLRV